MSLAPSPSAAPPAGLASAPQGAPKLRAKAEEFEAMVLGEMLTPMFEGTEPDGPFGGGPGESAFRGFLIQAYGTAIAKRGGVGLADHVLGALIALQQSQERP